MKDPDDESSEKKIWFDRWQVWYVADKKSRRDKFGTGLGYSIRQIFKLLRLMEEALVVARLTRAHNRFAFVLGADGMTPEERESHVKKIVKRLKKPSMIDKRSGRIRTDNGNPLNTEQDIFLTTSKDSPTDVKVLQGDLTIGNLEDVEYFLQKVLSGIKVPKAFLAHEKDTKARAVITEQDIQFARSVRRYQFLLTEAFKQLCNFQLRLEGIDPKSVQYELTLPAISTIDDLRYWQTEQIRQLAARMFKTNFWAADEVVMRDYLKLDEEIIQEVLRTSDPPDEYNGLLGQPKVGNAETKPEGEVESTATVLCIRAMQAIQEEDSEEFQRVLDEFSELRERDQLLAA